MAEDQEADGGAGLGTASSREDAASSAPQKAEEAKMEIHKARPAHSWREFFTELGTIVLGILIALGGEEIVSRYHWRGQMREAETAIASEMTYNLVGAIARVRSLDCGEGRLDALSAILDEAGRTGSLPPVGLIGGPVRHGWRSGAWESVVASQTAAHFPPEQLAALASLYQRVQRAELYATRELEVWSDLYAMVGPGRRLDPASETELRTALSRARDAGRTLTTVSGFVLREAAALDLPFTAAERQELNRIRNRPLLEAPRQTDDASTSFICGPVGPVPAHYGEAPEGEIPLLANQFARHLPDFGTAAP